MGMVSKDGKAVGRSDVDPRSRAVCIVNKCFGNYVQYVVQCVFVGLDDYAFRSVWPLVRLRQMLLLKHYKRIFWISILEAANHATKKKHSNTSQEFSWQQKYENYNN